MDKEEAKLIVEDLIEDGCPEEELEDLIDYLDELDDDDDELML